MKVDLEKLKLSVSPITGEVFVGITNKSGEKWLHKLEVTNQFLDALLHKFLGREKKKKTEIYCGSAKWDITVERIAD